MSSERVWTLEELSRKMQAITEDTKGSEKCSKLKTKKQLRATIKKLLQAENAMLKAACKRKDGIIKGLEVENAVLKDKLEAVNYNLKKKNYNLVASLAAANDRALVYRVKWEQADKRIGALTAACKHKDGIIKKLHESLESLCVFNPEIYQISKINSVLKVAKAELGEPVPCAACKRKDGVIGGWL